MAHGDVSLRNGRSTVVPVCSTSKGSCASAIVSEQMPAQYTDDADVNCSDRRFPVPEQFRSPLPPPPRSAQSLQAEASYRDWSEAPEADRPLARTRQKHAAALEMAMKKLGVSKSRLAMMLGLAERQVSKYLDGSKPIPTTIEDVLPTELRAEFVRLRTQSSPSAAFRSALTELEREGASQELILEGMRRLGQIRPKGEP